MLDQSDPSEGSGKSPPMGDSYWYPLPVRARYPRAHSFLRLLRSGDDDEHFITEESLAITSISRSDVFKRFRA